MARSLETDSLSNQNLTTALEVGSYTAGATRLLFVRLLVDQAAGNGNYTAYATLQVNGSGSAYRLIPITTAAAASGITALGFVSSGIPVDSGDIVKVYVLGLAGDTTTPDTRVDFYADNYLVPTTADRTLDVSSTGEAGLDWANIGSPTTTVALSGTTVKTATDVETDTQDIQGRLPAALVSGRMDSNMQAAANNVITASVIATDAIDADAIKTDAVTEIQSGLSTLTAAGVRTAVGLASANLDTQLDAIPTAAEIDTQLSNSHGSGTWGAGGNGGALSLTYTLTSSVDSTAIQGATVELYAESGMITLIDSQTTNALGQVTFNSLVAGTYYLKRIKPGFSFGNPDTEVVS